MVLPDVRTLACAYRNVRRATVGLCAPLLPEDCVIQTMPDVSPTKWHLAHTTWFFEQFILRRSLPSYRPFDDHYAYLFNSYYNNVGVRHCRAKRGQISRPTVKEVGEYRQWVDAHMETLWKDWPAQDMAGLADLILLGINHEQQHQELVLTDIKHVFACNPLHPVYTPGNECYQKRVPSTRWVGFEEGLYEIGHGAEGFCYDNETPRHKVFLKAFRVASRPVTNVEYLHFMEDGGYGRPAFWLSDGWDAVRQNGWMAPLYWDNSDGSWFNMTLNGYLPLDLSSPVCHVSFYEADAYSRWAGRRLLTEAEWEVAACPSPVCGNFAEQRLFHPAPLEDAPCPAGLRQMFGDVWEWTSSPYTGYPGYRPAAGAIGEYNGKFMSNQMVLRGGSCASPQSHLRPTYRNFFPPASRWQFSGIRLGDDA